MEMKMYQVHTSMQRNSLAFHHQQWDGVWHMQSNVHGDSTYMYYYIMYTCSNPLPPK